jgi:hypothetical protein
MDRNKRSATPPNADSHPAPSPVTPRRVPDGSTGGIDGKLQLQFTPSNRGSASVSEYNRSTRYGLHICLNGVFIIIRSVESVSPPIIADVKHHTSDCTVENLLKGMLSLCLPKEDKHNPAPDLLDQCLNAVLPICNAETKETRLREYLTE